jgi:predicted Zn-dependent peptidase
MKKLKLKNGIKVLLEHRNTDSVAIEIQIHVGSINENKKQAGMTHLIEHMLFEGTTNRTGQQIANEIESVGGEFNAATSHERTFYYVHIPKKYTKRAVDVLADMMKNPTFEEKILKKEKNVVINEIKVTDDDPKSYLGILFYKTLFKKHKAKNPIYGTIAAIKKMTRKDVVSYYKKYYTPANMTISIVGNSKNMLPLIKKHFENIPQQPVKKETLPQEGPLISPQRASARRDVEHTYVMIGYTAPNRSHKDSYTMEVIRSILGRGQSSRLFDEIRTKRGIAYIVGAAYEPSLTFGTFASYLSTTKDKVKEAKKVLREAFALKDLTNKEVQDAKNFIIGNHIIRNEDAKESVDVNAEWSLLNKDPKEFTKNIKKVTLKDVKRVAKKYFHKNLTEITIKRQH